MGRDYAISAVMTPTVHNPAAATQATASLAANAKARHQCVGIFASIAAAATAQTPIHLHLRDGATGGGTILASFILAAPANSCAWIELTDLALTGSQNTAMTLEFEAAGVAASIQSVTLLTVETIDGTTPA